MRHRISRTVLLAAAAVALAAPAVSAEVIYQTKDPFGGSFGVWGADVFESQSVALRVTPGARYTLDRISLWFMNNDGSGTHFDTVYLSLRNDAVSKTGGSIPGETIYESFEFTITAVGWDPQLESVDSVLHPALEAGTPYWIVAEAPVPGGTNPVWNFASEGTNFWANTDSASGGGWQDGGEAAALTAIVEGTRAFELSAADHVVAGEETTVLVLGARPDDRVWLAASRTGEGETRIERLHVTLGLAEPRRLGPVRRTDPAGGASWTFRVPSRLAGRTVWLQAAQFEGTSGVEVVTID